MDKQKSDLELVFEFVTKCEDCGLVIDTEEKYID